MPSIFESTARIDYVPATCTHRPSLHDTKFQAKIRLGDTIVHVMFHIFICLDIFDRGRACHLSLVFLRIENLLLPKPLFLGLVLHGLPPLLQLQILPVSFHLSVVIALAFFTWPAGRSPAGRLTMADLVFAIKAGDANCTRLSWSWSNIHQRHDWSKLPRTKRAPGHVAKEPTNSAISKFCKRMICTSKFCKDQKNETSNQDQQIWTEIIGCRTIQQRNDAPISKICKRMICTSATN